MNNNLVLGADIGGSHISAAVVDLRANTIVAGTRVRRPVDSAAGASDIIASWSAAFTPLLDKLRGEPVSIGIAMPGPFDYERGISGITNLGKYEALFGMNVKELLTNAIGVQENCIRLINDAAAFLRGEVRFGVARGVTDAIGVTLGTGTGTAIHHEPVTEDANLGPSPFMDSIADEYFSTRWFITEYARRTGRTVADVRTLADTFYQDAQAREVYQTFTGNFSEFLVGFVNREKPAAIVLGGNISRRADLFLPGVKQLLALQGITIPVLEATLGEDAAILGAASLFEANKR